MKSSGYGGAVYLEVEVQGVYHICFRRETLVNEI